MKCEKGKEKIQRIVMEVHVCTGFLLLITGSVKQIAKNDNSSTRQKVNAL